VCSLQEKEQFDSLGLNTTYVFGGQHYDEILVWFGALHFGGEIFGVNFWEVS